jgi:outer membrane protein
MSPMSSMSRLTHAERVFLRMRLAPVAVVTLVLAPAAAFAQAVPAPSARRAPNAPTPRDTIRLELTDAIARAVGQSEEVRLARSQVDLAGAQVTAARSAALPQIDGNVSYTRTFDSPFNTGGFTLPDSLTFEPDTTLSLEERVRYLERRAPGAGLGGIGALFGNLPFGQANSYVLSGSLAQPLYSGGRVGAGLAIAREYRDASELTLAESLADIELNVQNAYYRALLAAELEAISRAAVAQAESFLKQERLRLEAGQASDLDAMRAEVSLENLRPELVEAQNAASLALLDLKRLVDIPLAQPLVLTTSLTAPSAADLADPQVDALSVLARRASVQAAERQVEIRRQQVRVARGALLPSVSLSMNYGRQIFPSQVFRFTGQDWRTDWTASVNVSVPIFSGFRLQAEVDQARITLDQERLRLGQLRESVQLQFEQARGERQRAATTIAARQRTVDQAQRVHDLTVLRYEQGLATQLEVSDARLALLQARTNLAQAISDFRIADANLTRSLGGSPRAQASRRTR